MAMDRFDLASMLCSQMSEGTRRLEVTCDLDCPEDNRQIQAVRTLQELYRDEVIYFSRNVIREVLRVLGMGTWMPSPNETWIDLQLELLFGSCFDDSMAKIQRFAREMAPYISNVRATHPVVASSG